MNKIDQYRKDVYYAVLKQAEHQGFTNKDIVAEIGWPIAEESKMCQVRQIMNEMVLLGLVAQVASSNKLVAMRKTPFFYEQFIPNPFWSWK